jgi:maltooligosyltrehalose trehalohydrolase
VDEASWRAASALLLLAPETPLVFMGQEWSASSPFLYFTDHKKSLGRLVTEGRRKEFAQFAAFAAPEARARIPDPQSPDTFDASRLDWEEREKGIHASTLRLYRALLALRHERRLGSLERDEYAVSGGEGGVVLEVTSSRPSPMLVLAHLGGGGALGARPAAPPSSPSWKVLLSTEDPAFSPDPQPPRVEPGPSSAPRVTFRRAGAVVLVPS